MRVYKVDAQNGLIKYRVCTGLEHWSIEYNSLRSKVLSAKETKCDETCAGKPCRGIHQFIRKTVEDGKEFDLIT